MGDDTTPKVMQINLEVNLAVTLEYFSFYLDILNAVNSQTNAVICIISKP